MPHWLFPDIDKEKEIMRKALGIIPTRRIDVVSAYLDYYKHVRDRIVEAIGGYKNIKRIKELPAEPLETYFKIYIELEKPTKIILKLEDDTLRINDKVINLFIDKEVYTPFSFRFHRHFSENQTEWEKLKRGETVETTVEDFYVEVRNPLYWSKVEERFVLQPTEFLIGVYR